MVAEPLDGAAAVLLAVAVSLLLSRLRLSLVAFGRLGRGLGLDRGGDLGGGRRRLSRRRRGGRRRRAGTHAGIGIGALIAPGLGDEKLGSAFIISRLRSR